MVGMDLGVVSTATLVVVAVIVTPAMVHGHASVIMPPSRNAIDGVMPGTPWSGGKASEIDKNTMYYSDTT